MITTQTRDPDTLLKLLQEKDKQLLTLTAQMEKLQYRLDQLLNILYGTKSEKTKTICEHVVEQAGEKLAKPLPSSSDKKTANFAGRNALPEHLPQVKMTHDLNEEARFCPHCAVKLHCIGKSVSQQLDYRPAQFFVKKHIRYKYACRGCETVTCAPMPAAPIDKGLAGPGLLAEVLLNKYQDSLPLYRQQQRFARHGIRLPRSTLCDWVRQCAERLSPLVEHMKTHLFVAREAYFYR